MMVGYVKWRVNATAHIIDSKTALALCGAEGITFIDPTATPDEVSCRTCKARYK